MYVFVFLNQQIRNLLQVLVSALPAAIKTEKIPQGGISFHKYRNFRLREQIFDVPFARIQARGCSNFAKNNIFVLAFLHHVSLTSYESYEKTCLYYLYRYAPRLRIG